MARVAKKGIEAAITCRNRVLEARVYRGPARFWGEEFDPFLFHIVGFICTHLNPHEGDKVIYFIYIYLILYLHYVYVHTHTHIYIYIYTHSIFIPYSPFFFVTFSLSVLAVAGSPQWRTAGHELDVSRGGGRWQPEENDPVIKHGKGKKTLVNK